MTAALTYVEIDIPAFNDPNTVLLMHMDGEQGSTQFVDNAAGGTDTPHTVTTHGNVIVDRSFFVFGGASALFGGTISDFLSTPDSSDFEFGSTDFTIDLRVRLNSVASNQTFIGKWDNAGNARSWLLFYAQSSGGIQFNYSTNGSTSTSSSFSWAPEIDTWYHIAVVRNNMFLRVFVDGLQIGSTIDIGTDSFFNGTADVQVGRTGSVIGFEAPLDGYIDELRVSTVARWTDTFTPPIAPYPVASESGGPSQTFRFSMDANYYPKDIEAIPSITDISFTPATISLGEDLGQRATVAVNFRDHKHIFGNEPFDQGSFWGKFRGRYGLRLRGRPLRLIRGFLGQSLSQMDIRHYLLESSEGPQPQNGTFTLIAKDVLKLADGDRAQAPRLSNGFLITPVDDQPGSMVTLSPSGVGDAEYPVNGWVAIGGEEIAQFSRSGDVLTLTNRGEFGTTPASHEAEDRAQLVLRFDGDDPAAIISDLLEHYADISPAFIPEADWLVETGSFLQRVYTSTIAEPTSVKTLVSELIEQAALAMWWDDRTQDIRLQVLRAIPTTAARFDEQTILAGSLDSKEQPDTRISQVWIYYGQRNPLLPVDETDNYRSVEALVDLEAEDQYGGPAVKKVFSRWIPAFGRTVAQRAAQILLSRYVDPPRRFNFDIFREGGASEVVLGGGYRLDSWPLQTSSGAPLDVPIQITRLNPQADRFSVEAEEMLFSGDPVDLTNRVIIVDSNTFDFNLRTVHDTLYPPITAADLAASPPVNLTCIVENGVIVGANQQPQAFNVGSWPTGFPITLVVHGRIQGRGGSGGSGGEAGQENGSNGNNGQRALLVRENIDLDVTNGSIWGGGGGGGGGGGATTNGGGGGGGGAGQLPGSGGPGRDGGDDGNSGSLTSGGGGGDSLSANGGNGGGPGQNGQDGGDPGISQGGDGGNPGASIDGISFVTIIGGPGDLRGPQIN